MGEWFEGFGALEWTYFVLACIGTLFLLVQIVLMIVGAAEGDADLDTDTDGDGSPDTHTDTGLSLFTTKGLTAFFAIGGWTGLILLRYGMHAGIAVGVSLAAGLAAYIIVWLVIRLILRLQDDGTLNYSSAIGMQATVYVSVPPARSGRGKITFVLQGRYTEADAVTDEAERIPVDSVVTVISVQGDAFLVKKTENLADESEKNQNQ